MAVLEAEDILAKIEREGATEKRPHRAKAATPKAVPQVKAKTSTAEAVVRKSLEYPLRAAHDAWATILKDDYYRLTEQEVDSVVTPAVALAVQYGWEEAVVRISAPIALATALVAIEADRIGYMMSTEGPETEDEFMNAKPDIRTSGNGAYTPPTRVQEPVTSPTTNEARMTPPVKPGNVV